VPFQAAIDAGARVAMAGHLGVPSLTGRRDLPATLAPEVLKTFLRGDLGFGGLTVSDALDMGGIAGDDGMGIDISATLDAGIDLLLCGPDPATQARVEAGLATAMTGGRLDRRDADASAARLGDLQAWLAGFDQPSIDVVGSLAHRDLAAELARRSITLIRDEDGLVPVRPAADARILVIEPEPVDLTPADTTSTLPAGGLAAAVRARQPSAESHVIGAIVEPGQIGALQARAASADLVILGTVDALGRPSVVEFARALDATGTKLIAVALRGPWDATTYPEAGTVLATYGIQPPSLSALVDALWGDAPITGSVPVRLLNAGH
jgi:beta-N-acetylhexosaminidase